MEPIKRTLETGYLGTDPQGRLLTLRKESRVCSCGNEFIAHIKVIDGKDELDGFTICLTCRNKVEAEKRRQERLALIPQLEQEQEWLWDDDCNLPPKFALKTFENFERKLQPKAFDLLKNYDLAWDDDKNEGPPSIVLLSPDLYGVGKTHLVAALFNQLIATERKGSIHKDGSFSPSHCPVYFSTENALLSRIRATFNRKDEDCETEEEVYRFLEKVRLLAIDDVGKVRPRDYSFLQGVYFRIVDDRYASGEPIILTTNLGFTELENHIGGASADRLREMAGDNFLVMKGTSYRQKSR